MAKKSGTISVIETLSVVVDLLRVSIIIIILYSEWNWNGGPRGYPYYRASYLTTFKYYLQLIKFENFTTKKKEHARDTI